MTAKFQTNSPAICGSLHPATNNGFLQMLLEANEALTAGYDFVGFQRLDKQLGAVYRRSIPVKPQPIDEDRAVLVG